MPHLAQTCNVPCVTKSHNYSGWALSSLQMLDTIYLVLKLWSLRGPAAGRAVAEGDPGHFTSPTQLCKHREEFTTFPSPRGKHWLIFVSFFLLSVPFGLWDLSCLTRDRTHAPYSRSKKSYPLGLQESPEVLLSFGGKDKKAKMTHHPLPRKSLPFYLFLQTLNFLFSIGI